MLLAHWTHNLSPYLGPHWGNFGLRYYGLAYVLGFVGGGRLRENPRGAFQEIVAEVHLVRSGAGLALGS